MSDSFDRRYEDRAQDERDTRAPLVIDTDDDSAVDTADTFDVDARDSEVAEYDENGKRRGKVGEALKRDWDQTKSDFHMGGKDLNQNIDDTVAQATGGQPLPPRNVPNLDEDSVDEDAAYDRVADDSNRSTDAYDRNRGV